MKTNTALIFIFAIVVFLAVIFVSQTNKNPAITTVPPTLTPLASSSPSNVLGVRTKTADCTALAGLPDKNCTPGAIFQDVTKDQVCAPGYAKSVRNVPTQVKDEVYREYGITSHQPGEYEVDHLISLELGGSNEIANLWPEAAEPRPGFHEKDQIENYLHDQVCSGAITLQQAQKEITNNWLTVYQQIPY